MWSERRRGTRERVRGARGASVGIGSDPAIRYAFIYPGWEYGGSGFPKGVRSLIRVAASAGYGARLLQAVEDVNEPQKGRLFAKLQWPLGGKRAGRRLAPWALSFKPSSDDAGEAPSHGAGVTPAGPAQ